MIVYAVNLKTFRHFAFDAIEHEGDNSRKASKIINLVKKNLKNSINIFSIIKLTTAANLEFYNSVLKELHVKFPYSNK